MNQNLYDPAAAPASFEVLNGWLDNANRQAGWSVRAPQIRNRSMADGSMVGVTGCRDYTQLSFSSAVSDAGAYVPIVGTGQAFYLPISPTVTILTWQCILANDNDTLVSLQAVPGEMAFFVDGLISTPSHRTLPHGVDAGTRFPYHDRIYSGHHRPLLTSGWHTAHLALWLPGHPGGDATVRTVRARTSRICVHWIR